MSRNKHRARGFRFKARRKLKLNFEQYTYLLLLSFADSDKGFVGVSLKVYRYLMRHDIIEHKNYITYLTKNGKNILKREIKARYSGQISVGFILGGLVKEYASFIENGYSKTPCKCGFNGSQEVHYCHNGRKIENILDMIHSVSKEIPCESESNSYQLLIADPSTNSSKSFTVHYCKECADAFWNIKK